MTTGWHPPRDVLVSQLFPRVDGHRPGRCGTVGSRAVRLELHGDSTSPMFASPSPSGKSIYGCQCTLRCYAPAWLAVDSSRTFSGGLDTISWAERIGYLSIQGPSRALRRAKEYGLEDCASARTLFASLHRQSYLCHRVRAQDLPPHLPRPGRR